MSTTRRAPSGPSWPRWPDEIAAATQATTLVELGAGAADKTRLLLDALRAAGTLRSFVPVDVSETALIEAADRVLASYPGLSVRAVVSDFEEHLGLPDATGPRLVAFLGGTIGNLLPGAAGRVPGLGQGAAGRPATRCCSAPTWSRTRPCCTPPTTTRPGSPPRSTRTCWPC